MQSRCLAVCALAALTTCTAAALDPAEVLILVNSNAPESGQTAKLYLEARKVPPGNVLRLELGTDHSITREEYRTKIVPAVKKRLSQDPNIRCLLTTAGFPYTIQPTAGREDGAAVDNELAAVLRDAPADLNRWQPNPLYMRGGNPYGAVDPRAVQMVFVARLEAPDATTIARMVNDAIATEQSGLQGPVFGDTQGLDGSSRTAAADASIRAAVDRLAGAGFRSTLDMEPATWRAPAGGVGEQAAGAAFYVGWYSLQSFQDVFGKQGLARGAIAWHIASGEAASPWSSNTGEWCPNLLRRGAAVTLGPAFEPYLAAFPKAELMVEQLLLGRTIAESYWLALPHVSWAMVLLGDPLYRPFARPRPALVARAYTAAAPGHVLRTGQTAPLLVRLQCIGPAGSATPPFSANLEAGKGLTRASGKVNIPALNAGQSAVVTLPPVTAGPDATGMFRLALNSDAPETAFRSVVVEGRVGFSLLHGGAGESIEMFSSPNGRFVIAGLPGAASLIDTGTLESRHVPIPNGWLLFGAAFSPDESRLVLTYLQPQNKQALSVLTDRALSAARNLPPETQFLRWQSNDKLLLKGPSALLEYSIPLAAALPIAVTAGWEPNSIIAGTDTVVLRNAEAGWAIRKIGQPEHRVLEGTGLVRDTAIADDLSHFGGVDAQNRFWAQRGLDGKPAVVAEGVLRVGWGPISRRAAVLGANGETRIYEGRDGNWTPLGSILRGNWSAAENRFLYVTAANNRVTVPDSLALWEDGKIRELCSMSRIGDLGGLSLSRNGDTAFLLAGPENGLEVWLLGLPTPQTTDSPHSAR